MEKITEEYIANITKNWTSFKGNIQKIDGIIDDINNCKSETSKSILVSYANKLFENMIQNKVFLQDNKTTV